MILQSLSSMWTALAPAVGNHLWQSTLFAVAAGLLTLALRRNQARARYWLWLAASVKFLVPFSALVAMGSRLSWSHALEGSNKGLYVVIEGFILPFPQTPVTQPASAMFLSGLANMLPALLAAGWLCGFVVVLFMWLLRYRKLSASLTPARPLREGREVEAMDRLASVGGVRKKINIFLSPTSLEPGILGIARPALVCPEGISTVSKTPILMPFWHTKCGMCAAMTIWPRWSTCWWKQSSGFIRWCGGWGAGWWKSANGRATRKCCGQAVSGRFMPKAF